MTHAVAEAMPGELPAPPAPPEAAEPIAPALPAAAPAVAPAMAAATALTKVEPFELPIDELRELAASAGLEWVNSDAERILVVQQTMASEPRPVHVPRVPRPRVVIDDGPLVLVETRKDLSQMKLPFEQQPPAQA
jgi:ribonuclease E